MTLEQQAKKNNKELQNKVKKFQAELGKLLGKYDFALQGVPQLTPDGRLYANIRVVRGEEVRKAQEQIEDNGLAKA